MEGPVDCVSKDEVVQVLKEITPGNFRGSSHVLLKLIAADREVGM